METFFYIAFGIFSVYTAIVVTYIIALLVTSKQPVSDTSRKVSVLVAARNEEANILDCLESLAAQNYPKDKFEVLIGDDASDDATSDLVQQFIQDHPNFHYHLISTTLNEARGKQNVLAQLAHKAEGDAFLVTDADVTVPPTWAANLMGALKGNTGMVSGPTIVEDETLFGKVQSLDWLLGITINKAHQALRIPLTGVGSNMAVSRESYASTGGYENIPFSITEDYKLFKEMVEEGEWKFNHLFHPSTLGIAQKAEGWAELARQRKRWFAGGGEIIWYNKIFMGFNAILMPLLIACLFVLPLKWFAIFYATKVVLNFLILLVASVLIGKTKNMIYFPIYELYYQLTVLILPINQLIPGKIMWKGRAY